MPDPSPPLRPTIAPRGFAAARPLQVPTLLLVEDSRYASEVMRHYARILGLRLRRAADLDSASTHLALYRPDIVMIDLGLPDGRGEELIARLHGAATRPPLIIATSGQVDHRTGALASGADVFVEKPMLGIANFRALLVDHFPGPLPLLLITSTAPSPKPDQLALQDDLSFAAKELAQSDLRGDYCRSRARYIAGLLDGVAGSMGDHDLQQAARDQLAEARHEYAESELSFRHLRDLVNERLRDVAAQRGI